MKHFKLCSFLLVTQLVGSANAFTSERLTKSTRERESTTPRSSSIRGAQSNRNEQERRNESKDIRITVRYSDGAARYDVVSSATEVIDEFVEENLLIVGVTDEVYDYLKENDHVEVEIDHKVEGFGNVHRHHLPPTMQRRQEEEVPYGIQMIQADQFDVPEGSPITVCIVDTGYAYGHPDLPLTTTGDDALMKGWLWNEDLNGHGTHVAGTIAAIKGNGIGVTGAGNINLHITRGLDEHSSGYESDVRRAVEQCVAAGAKVISLSLGSPSMSNTARDLYTKTVEEDGLIMVAASGNQGKQLHAYPASHPSVISVSAVYEWNLFWDGSNYSDQVELAAPGFKIKSTTVSTSAVHATDMSYPAYRVSGAPSNDVEGNLIYCGSGDHECEEAAGAVCLLVREGTDLSVMLENCERGGGIGAVVFTAADTLRAPTGDWDASSPIPAVGVKHTAGLDLLSSQNSVVALGQAFESDDIEYTYDYFTGTSMATPHVAVAAALVWSHFPECSNHQIRHALAVTAQDQGIPGCDWDYGFGIVKAKDAYDFLKARDCSQGDWWHPNGYEETVCERSFPTVPAYAFGSSSGTSSPTSTPSTSKSPSPSQ